MKAKAVRVILMMAVLSLIVPLPLVSPYTYAATSYTSALYVVRAAPQSLDPALASDQAGIYILQQVYETLIAYQRGRTDAFVPRLADSWQVSGDGLTYTFHLRPGVRFHDGAALTAADAAYSLRRALLQGGSSSPMVWLAEPLLGAGISDVSFLVDPSGNLLDNRTGLQAADANALAAACQKVSDAVAFDEAAGTLTLHLAQRWNAFLHALAGEWASIIDRDWAIAHGAWDGSCATWQNFYYDKGQPAGQFFGITNGSGPFRLQEFGDGTQIVLARNDRYWRAEADRPGGPVGPAFLEQVTLRVVKSITDRIDMLEKGEADLADLESSFYSFLFGSGMVSVDVNLDSDTINYQNGVTREYRYPHRAEALDGFFNFSIAPDSPYLACDEGSLPAITPDFFTDVHVRRGFAYAMEYMSLGGYIYNAMSFQRLSPVGEGADGYFPASEPYSQDVTQATAEFSQAFGGTPENNLLTNGFSLTLAYPQGDDLVRTAAAYYEFILESLYPGKVQICTKELAPDLYQAALANGELPLSFAIHQVRMQHAYAWAREMFLTADGQNRNDVEEQRLAWTACLSKVGSEAAACYRDLQATAYQNVEQLYLLQNGIWILTREEIRGYEFNPALAGPYLYNLSKGPPSTLALTPPDEPASVTFTDALGLQGQINIPAISDKYSYILATPGLPVYGRQKGYLLSPLSFDLIAYTFNDEYILGRRYEAPPSPIQIELHYTPQSAGMVSEDSLRLFVWDGTSWNDAACGEINRDLEGDTLTVPVCRFGRFALGGEMKMYYFPIVGR